MNWEKTGSTQYELRQGDHILANMKISGASAVCTIGSRLIHLQRRGFWQSAIEMTDHNGQVLLRTEPAKWWGSKSIFNWNSLPYELDIRNAPLAEYFICQGGHEVLAYGLKAGSGKTTFAISETDHLQEEGVLELHLLLWFLFHPIVEGETTNFISDEALVSVISA